MAGSAYIIVSCSGPGFEINLLWEGRNFCFFQEAVAKLRHVAMTISLKPPMEELTLVDDVVRVGKLLISKIKMYLI